VRLLEDKGIRILNVIPAQSTLQEVRRAPEASLNIVMEHYALPLARQMERMYGTPYVYVERAYTPDSVADGYRQIAARLGIDLHSVVDPMQERVVDRIRDLRPMLEGKTFVLGGQAGRTFDLARLMIQLGMEPLQLYAHDLLPDDPADIRALLADGYDPPVVNTGSALENDRFLAELRPDYFVGHADARSMARLGIQARNLIPATHFPGFAGTQAALGLLAQPPAGTEILHFKEQLIVTETGASPWLW
jgi:nitrogenase molybdenum-cofactor synthesis protein NifE